MKLEKKTFDFEVKNITEEDPRFFVIEGLASTFDNIDHGNDRVKRNAFTRSIEKINGNAQPIKDTQFNSLIPMLWQHKMDEPIGSFIDIIEVEEGLFVRGIMPKSDSLVKERIKPQLDVGSIRKMSIGYMVDDDRILDGVRDLFAVDLKEVSLVTFPMNDKATITGVKGATSFQDFPLADFQRSWDSAQAVKRIQAATNSADAPSDRYKQAFLWFDSANENNFGAYKLPVADVIDGVIKVVPRAVFAAAAALQGARGGVDIPDGDRNQVRRHIDKYYQKMNRESPFKSLDGFRVDDLSTLTERQLEKFLKSGIFMNENTAKHVVSLLKAELDRDGKEKAARDAKKAEEETMAAKLAELNNKFK